MFAIFAVSFAAAGVAQAKHTNYHIVLGKSIGAVSVGMTRAQVESLLGHGLVIGRKGVRVELWSKLGLTFFTPALPHDLDVLSRPVTYLTLTASSETPQTVSALVEVDPIIAVNTSDEPGCCLGCRCNAATDRRLRPRRWSM